MLLKHFLADVARWSRGLDPYTEVNVEGVGIGSYGLTIDVGFEDREAELKDAKSDRDEALRDTKDAQNDRDAYLERAEKAEAALEELKTELENLKDENGLSAAHYREIAEKATQQVDECREHVQAANQRALDAKTELTAMRKRKGVEPGLMACSYDVWTFLGYLSQATKHPGNATPEAQLQRYQNDANKLLERIRSKA